jgi:hypothetical protein
LGFLPIITPCRAFAQTGPDEPLKVLVEAEQEGLEVGVLFLLTLVVNHAEIAEVEVVPPDFGEAFRIERQRVSSRYAAAGTMLRNTPARDAATVAAARASVFEFTLLPLEEGAQLLPPFVVRARGMETRTEEIPLTIAAPRALRIAPMLRWQTPLPPLKVGEQVVIRLLVSDSRNLTRASFTPLRFEAPPEAIVESRVVFGETAAAVIELRVIPMYEGAFVIKARDFQTADRAGNALTLRVPELRGKIVR